MKNLYRVRPGFRHGKDKQFGPGDTVELTAEEAAGFLDKLELVAPEPDPVEAELEPVVRRSRPAPKTSPGPR